MSAKTFKKKKYPIIGQEVSIALDGENEGKTEVVTVIDYDYQAIKVKTLLGTIFFINLWEIL